MSNFKPLNVDSIPPDVELHSRMAHALEFIALQLGEINQRLARQEQNALLSDAKKAVLFRAGGVRSRKAD